MMERASSGAWVEVHAVILKPGKRAPQVPADTQCVPLEMTVKGFLDGEASIGDTVEIVTPAGRRVQGTLRAVNPPYVHQYGAPIKELSCIARELRELLSRNSENLS